MTATEIVEELEALGTDQYKRTMMRHGVTEPFYGVKIEELKKYEKRIKKDYQLALDLYATNVYDAMYLAGLIADETRMTRDDLRAWLAKANRPALAQYTVPWVASESPHGRELALEWIESADDQTAMAGWATLSSYVAVTPDSALDTDELARLLDRVRGAIHDAPNCVRYVMNSFVIAVGSYVAPLSDRALQTAVEIGTVSVDLVGDCKLPSAPEYIEKVRARGTVGKKRKTAKC